MNKLKHVDKSLINFRNTHLPKKEHKTKDDDIMCYNCGISGHSRTTFPSLTKHRKKRDYEFYKTKGNNSKDRRAYITWE